MDPAFIFFIAILVMSVVIHEVSHGFTAEMLGDQTARMAGRLTLNPVSHFDMVGSFIVPVVAFFTTGLVFGWAKPVPYNPYNLKNQKWGPGIVAFAGPASNLLMAFLFGMMLRFHDVLGLTAGFVEILGYIVLVNILLAIFNMVPIPPLDGSKVLSAFLPYKYMHIMDSLERYSIFVLILFIFFGWKFVYPLISVIFSLITGMIL